MASLKSLADLACLLPVVAALPPQARRKPARKAKPVPAKASDRPSDEERYRLPSGLAVYDAIVDAAETLPDLRPPKVRMTPARRRIEKAMELVHKQNREVARIRARRPLGVPAPQLEPKSIHSPAPPAMTLFERPKRRYQAPKKSIFE